MTKMIVREVWDRESIEAILLHPEIVDTITDDNGVSEIPINDDFLYVGGFVGGEIIAIMVYHAYKDGNKCHVQVLPDFREDYAQEFGEQSLMFRGTQPLYAEIPSLYQNVLSFAKMFGFEIIETLKDEHKKHGINYDIHVLRFKSWDSSET